MNAYRRTQSATRFTAQANAYGRHAGNRGFSSAWLAVLLLAMVTIATTVWVGMGIVAKERWPIRWLDLNGSFQRVSAEQLRVNLAALSNTSFFTLDMQGLQQAAAKNPWVAAVSVKKTWPDTVTVTVEEYVPIAHWNSGYLISSTGHAFATPEADEIQGLPWLSGPQDRLDQVLDAWTKFDARLNLAALDIARLSLDERGAWSMQLSSGTRLHLGRDAANERLERLMKSWPVLVTDAPLPPLRVDLRYTNGFAVLWPEEPADFAGTDY